jgi:hypothetical protein
MKNLTLPIFLCLLILVGTGIAASKEDKNIKNVSARNPAAVSGQFICGETSFQGDRYEPSMTETLIAKCDPNKAFGILEAASTENTRYCCIAR